MGFVQVENVFVSLPRATLSFVRAFSNLLRLILLRTQAKIEGLWTAIFVTLTFRSSEPGTAARENLLSSRITEMSDALRIQLTNNRPAPIIFSRTPCRANRNLKTASNSDTLCACDGVILYKPLQRSAFKYNQ